MAKVRAYRCARTGVFFPGDYVEQWGRKYGIGLGPTPISEALVNMYSDPVVKSAKLNETMHPLGNALGQVDLVEVDEAEYLANKAVLAVEDPDYQIRGQIMRGRQLVHSETMAQLFPEESVSAKKAESEKIVGKIALAK